MRFKIPFTFSSVEILKRRTKFLLNIGRYLSRNTKNLGKFLKDSGVDITKEEYMSVCVYTQMFTFVILLSVFTTLLGLLSVQNFWFLGLGLALLFSLFVFFAQINYPKIYVFKEGRLLDRNLIPALQDILVQLKSGVPLFDIMVNVSKSKYGEVSDKFKQIVRDINAGRPQIESIEKVSKKTSSVFFRRTLWQISNGLRAGSRMDIVISESIENLNTEKLLQIQTYGSRLNPLVVFYMLIAIILPALSISFLTIIASMIGLGRTSVTLLFIGVFVVVMFIQIMFLGLIKSKRPSLL